MIITIDGPEASGKSTIAKIIAKKYNFFHLNSGLLYRIIGITLLNQNIIDNTKKIFTIKAIMLAKQITINNLNNLPENIHSINVGINASKIAIIPEVRHILTKNQQYIISKKNNAIIDGRDTGTVVFPNADLKFWITANLKCRANRRFIDYKSKGFNNPLKKITKTIKERDYRDTNRSTSPMKKPFNAHLIDTSKMSINTVVKVLSTHINTKLFNLYK